MNNAKVIFNGLQDAGYTVSGGVNAPYIWLKTPDNMTSWEFFDHLLPTSLEHQDQDSDQAEKDTSDLQRSVTMRIQSKLLNESRECNF